MDERVQCVQVPMQVNARQRHDELLTWPRKIILVIASVNLVLQVSGHDECARALDLRKAEERTVATLRAANLRRRGRVLDEVGGGDGGRSARSAGRLHGGKHHGWAAEMRDLMRS